MRLGSVVAVFVWWVGDCGLDIGFIEAIDIVCCQATSFLFFSNILSFGTWNLLDHWPEFYACLINQWGLFCNICWRTIVFVLTFYNQSLCLMIILGLLFLSSVIALLWFLSTHDSEGRHSGWLFRRPDVCPLFG